MDINETEDGCWYVSRIIVPEKQRNQGWGTALMRKLVTWADQKVKVLLLEPVPYTGDTDKSRLISWYGKFGFSPYMPENCQIYRRLPGLFFVN